MQDSKTTFHASDDPQSTRTRGEKLHRKNARLGSEKEGRKPVHPKYLDTQHFPRKRRRQRATKAVLTRQVYLEKSSRSQRVWCVPTVKDVVDSLGVEGAAPPENAVDFVTFFQKKLTQISAPQSATTHSVGALVRVRRDFARSPTSIPQPAQNCHRRRTLSSVVTNKTLEAEEPRQTDGHGALQSAVKVWH